MTKAIAKKPQNLKSARPAGRVTKPKAVKASYFRAIDLMLASVAYAKAKQPVRAAKALADALQDPQIDDAMEYLNDQQTQGMDQFDDVGQDQDPVFTDEQQMSKTLARLIRGAQTAEASDEDEDEEDDSDADEDDADEEDEEDEDDKDSEESAVDEDQTEDDGLDIAIDEEDEDGDAQEQQVQASVASRLARAQRNKQRRA